MNCENIRNRLLEKFGQKELPQELLSHLNDCTSCHDFWIDLETLAKSMGNESRFYPDESEISEMTEQIDNRIDRLELDKVTRVTPMWKYFVPVAAAIVIVLGIAMVGNIIYMFDNDGGITEQDQSNGLIMVFLTENDYEDLSGINIDDIIDDYSPQNDFVSDEFLTVDITEEEYRYLEENLNIGEIL